MTAKWDSTPIAEKTINTKLDSKNESQQYFYFNEKGKIFRKIDFFHLDL